MNPPNREQKNRFLESPFVIRNTSPEGQVSFGTGSGFTGGDIFNKDSFCVPLNSKEGESCKEAEENNELDDLLK